MKIKRNETVLADLAHYSKKVVQQKLVVGPGGNTSIRDNEMMWISPSGYSLDELSLEDWVPVDIVSGKVLEPNLKPSSEIAMHLEIYRSRKDVNAIVHTHPPITIGVISTELNEIPPMFPDFVVLVGKVPCIDYVVPCSNELAQAVIEVLQNPIHSSLLLKNHGLITLGANMKQAYFRTEVIEDAARVYWISKTVGTPNVLTEKDVQDIINSEAEKYRQKLLDQG